MNFKINFFQSFFFQIRMHFGMKLQYACFAILANDFYFTFCRKLYFHFLLDAIFRDLELNLILSFIEITNLQGQG